MSDAKFFIPLPLDMMDPKEIAFAQQMGSYYKDAHPEVQKIWDLAWNAAFSAVLPVENSQPAPQQKERKHNHYFKPCPYNEVDVYRVLLMFGVTDPCLQHATKKLLVAGGRGAGNPIDRDVREAIDTLERWCEMRAEEPAVQA